MNAWLAVGEIARLKADAGHAFEELKKFSQATGRLAIRSFFFRPEIRNRKLSFPSSGFYRFPDLFFFVPEIIVLICQQEIQIGLFGNHHQEVFE